MVSTIVVTIGGLVAAAVMAWATLRTRAPGKTNLQMVDAFSTKHSVSERLPEHVPARSFEPSFPVRQTSGKPISSSTSIGVEIVDIDVPVGFLGIDHPVVDLKFYNAGGHAVVLKRMIVEVLWARQFNTLEDFLPYRDLSGPLALEPSGHYEIQLPAAEKADSAHIASDISQVIAPGEADRIQVLLKTDFEYSRTSEIDAAATSVYLLRFEFLYNADNRRISSDVIAVACPGNCIKLPTPEALSRKIEDFLKKVTEIREAIDSELTHRGHAAPEWAGADSPRQREDLPPGVLTLDRNYWVNDDFWYPERAISLYLDAAENLCHELIDNLSPEMPDGLAEAILVSQRTLAQIPELRKHFE